MASTNQFYNFSSLPPLWSGPSVSNSVPPVAVAPSNSFSSSLSPSSSTNSFSSYVSSPSSETPVFGKDHVFQSGPDAGYTVGQVQSARKKARDVQSNFNKSSGFIPRAASDYAEMKNLQYRAEAELYNGIFNGLVNVVRPLYRNFTSWAFGGPNFPDSEGYVNVLDAEGNPTRMLQSEALKGADYKDYLPKLSNSSTNDLPVVTQNP